MSVSVKISKRLACINSASSLVTMLLRLSVLIWLQQYLLRRISPEEYSLIPVLGALMLLLPLLTVFLTSGIARYAIASYAKGDEREVTQIISTMFPFLFGAGLFVFVVGCFLTWNIDSVLKIAPERIWDARIMLAIMMFSFALRLSLAPFGVGINIHQKFVLQNGIRLGTEILRFITLFILLFCVSTSVVWVIVASASASLAGLLVTNAISRRLVPALRFRPSEFRWNLARTLVSFGGWTVISSLGERIRKAADPLILNRLATPVDITTFHLGAMVDGHVRTLMMTLTSPLQPALTAMHVTGKKDQLTNMYLRIGRLSIWVMAFMVCPLIVFHKELFQLYLQEKFSVYASAPTVMLLLLVYLPVSYSMYGLNKIAVATAKIRAYTLLTGFSQLFNLGLTFYFVGVLHMGAIGSALATFSSGILFTLFGYCPLSLKLVDIDMSKFLRETIFPGFLPGIVGTTIWMLLRISVQPTNWVELGVCTAVGMIIYMAVLLIFCLQPADRNDLRIVMAKVGL